MLKYLKFKYFFLFLVCIWIPLQIFVLKVDAAQRTIGFFMFLLILVNIANGEFMQKLIKAPILYWGIWVIYAFVNTVLLGYKWDVPVYSFFIIIATPLMVIWIISSEDFEDRNVVFNIIIAGLFLRVLLIFIFEKYRESGRFGYYIDSNSIAFSALILIWFLYMRFLYKEISIWWFLMLILIPLIIIFRTASRNAFGALLILFSAHFYINRSKRVLRDLTLFFGGLFVISMVLLFVMEKTFLGERLSETTSQSSDVYYNEVHGTVFEKFGDRGIFYILGFRLFKEHPIRGIGLGNFKTFQGTYVMHSEYMIQLSELGLIGTLFFVFFYGWIGKKLIIYRKSENIKRKITEGYLMGFLIILFMGLSIFQYNDPVIFMLNGAAIAYLFSTKKEIIIR